MSELFTIQELHKEKETKMKKIEYQAPVMEVVKLRGPQVLLDTSDQNAPDPNNDDYD